MMVQYSFATLVGDFLLIGVVLSRISHLGACYGSLATKLYTLASFMYRDVKYLFQTFWTWSVPGDFQLTSLAALSLSLSTVTSFLVALDLASISLSSSLIHFSTLL